MALPSPYAVALLLALNAQRYASEKGKNTPRLRLSRSSLASISRRSTFREAFWSELEDSLDDLGWTLLRTPDGIALVDTASVSGWTKISSSRISGEMKGLKRNKISEEDLEELMEAPEEAADDTDAEGE